MTTDRCGFFVAIGTTGKLGLLESPAGCWNQKQEN